MDLRNFIAGYKLQVDRKHIEAIEKFKLALLIDPEFCYAYSSLSVSYYHIKDMGLALECAEKAVSLAPNISRFHYQMGVILYGRASVAESIDAYNIAIGLNNSHATYFCARAISNERLCRWKSCIDDCTSALQLDANCWQANLKLADILATCDDDSLRSKACLRYVTLAQSIIGDNDWRVFSVLAAAHAENDEWAAAERAAESALLLAPDSERPRRLRRLDQIRAHVRITRSNGFENGDFGSTLVEI